MKPDFFPISAGASPEFCDAVKAYASRVDTDRVRTMRTSPRVKVLRVIRQLLERESSLRVERVIVDAMSGCSDFRGTLQVECDGELREFEFVWDCQWRAEQQKWVDAFGFPDQIRAAREFDWDCFSEWHQVGVHARFGAVESIR